MWLIDVNGNAVNAALVSKIFVDYSNDAFEVKADITAEDDYFTLATFYEGTAEENRTAAKSYLENLLKQLNKEA